MTLRPKLATGCVLALLFPAFVFGQKVKVDYDKSVEFGKFKTYSWADLGPAAMPMVRAYIVSAIDHELETKGLTEVEKDADVVVAYSGALQGETNQGVSTPAFSGYSGPPPAINSTMWTGAGGGGMSVTYPKGTLIVEMMQPSAGRITWRAVGKTKLDMEKKEKSMKLINETIEKMFEQYPPKEEK